MNEIQHDAQVQVQMAQSQVTTLTIQLNEARTQLQDKQKELDQAIRLDPGSWYATPHDSSSWYQERR